MVIAGVVFSSLLTANLFVFGHLAFRDLGVRIRKEAISRAQERALTLARALAGQGRIDLWRVHEKLTVFSSYVDQVLTGERFVRTVTLYDVNGRPAGSWSMQGGRVFSSALGFHLPQPGVGPAAPSAEGPSLRMDVSERDRYVAVPIQSGGERRTDGTVEVGIDQAAVGKEIDDLRRSLLIKIAVGAAVSVALLLVAFVWVVRLIARTRRLEAEAQMADRLAYVGTLASGLAHEIRNPLNAMNMNLQMLEEEMASSGGDPAEETQGLLESTKGEIRRLEHLVTDFLAYARPAEPKFEGRDLNRTVEEVLRFLAPELRGNGIALEVALDPALPPVEFDEGQMRQALLNILINARQVLKDGGRIEVASGRSGEEGIWIRVRDDGPGVPPELRERIFEVFYSTRGGGTGLGLPIAQRIVEAHGGWIELKSEPGRGAAFILHLPLQRPAASAAQTGDRQR